MLKNLLDLDPKDVHRDYDGRYAPFKDNKCYELIGDLSL